ncbi:exodeoxyribonuclease V subunit alpha [Ursidibacter maritimus]|uniref:RecBCD enzyme subunit RecD n=1 Tax=Ursidibacter maritimus TaxID=1331689 RepID=A0A949T245_9PAST|nr:exodeoxyribonuclease V subunit alpha [Ursidibacter maritimus]KAE9542149.1 exodeoxyribonuclease V subunit alpha [Ursidibacter maritimus]MBV6524212.1 exodeoxyribonuclease V subunit alpha [Ursidibacter maritimus]MBV6525160.1 exodeoxyribonuclease V subunit alpha [Ursidibacter maritimus]MBV6528423.1 exodeoxyribonuclease V subunit alpha [Ursidibacter maritimus]MBV6530061.1 exodeoxyribonuclease V subunit alpha [Ursidibacter maritimus]
MLTLLAYLKSEKLISELNYQFAKLIDNKQQNQGYSKLQQDLAILVSALVSFNVMQGHSCIRLDSALASNPFGLNRELSDAILQKIEHISPLEWQSVLANHIAFSADPNKVTPMLFQHQRVYFYRYWQAENQIAQYLQQAVSLPTQNTNFTLEQQIITQFFPEKSENIDWQKIAVATALKQSFSIISGGPGTGKTRTVAILLAALQLKQLKLGLPLLNIALVAPTGKAAARLKESIHQNLQGLSLPDNLKNEVPTKASTIHSLIGIYPHSDTPRYHSQNPLHIDLIVVDEASMIDLFVMDKLLNALKPNTRVILLGDKDQLASVEAGSMMSELGQFLTLGYSPAHSHYLSETTGEMIPAKSDNPPFICDSLCHLRHSYRFDDRSGIGQLAKEINAQQAISSWDIFADSQFTDLSLCAYPNASEFATQPLWTQHCVEMVVKKAVMLYRDYLQEVKHYRSEPTKENIQAIFTAFQQVRFLSALRVSELGVEKLNHTIAEALLQHHLVHFRNSRENYIGKPILVTENAPQLNIYSGDIGIILPDEQGKLRVYFETQTEKGDYLSISVNRLPSNEPAYVMTVHKSQGSEFAHTLLIMPLTFSPVISKELLYTAVTRAKSQFTLFSNEKIWKQGVNMKIQRQSGLTEQLASFH